MFYIGLWVFFRLARGEEIWRPQKKEEEGDGERARIQCPWLRNRAAGQACEERAEGLPHDTV